MRFCQTVFCCFIVFLTCLFSCTTKPVSKPIIEEKLPSVVEVIPEPKAPKELTEEEKEAMAFAAVEDAIISGNYEIAANRLKEMLANYPSNRTYPLMYSSILLSLSKFDEAKSVLNKELELQADNMEALLMLAELEYFSGNDDEHKMLVEKMLNKEPSNEYANTMMGDINYSSKNYNEAQKFYTKVLTKNPKNVDALVGSARILFRDKKMTKALELLETAATVEENNPIVFTDKSKVLYELGRYKESVNDLSKAIELAPNNSWNYIERGKYYYDTKRNTEAIKDFSKAIELDPSYFLSYVYRAAIFEEEGRDAEALSDFAKISKINPEYWYSLESVGVLSYRLGKYNEAADAFSKALTHTKNHPEYYIATALCIFRTGNKKLAKEYAGKNLAMINREKNPLDWLALRLFYDQTVQTAEIEIKINNEKSVETKARALYFLGAYWLSNGMPELATKYLEMSLTIQRYGPITTRMAEADLESATGKKLAP